MLDFYYSILNSFSDRDGVIYRYLYKILKVLLNIFFPIGYKKKVPMRGKICEDEVIVSVTTYPARIDTVWQTVYTLLNQSVRATKVILWLAESQIESFESLPYSLKRLTDYGLEIKFCEDLKSHKKYFFAMKQYPSAIVITADDDVYYPMDWIEKILEKHRQYPDAVCCYWAHRIVIESGKIVSYNQWEKCIKDGNTEPSDLVLPVGYAGVLYPPHTLDERAFEKELIKELSLSADDLWLKAMSYLNGKKAILVFPDPVKYFAVIKAQRTSLFQTNVGQNVNDTVLNNLLQHFEELNSFTGKNQEKQ